MTAAVVLAAGRGERLGGPKSAVAVAGRTFLARILETLAASGVTTVRVVHAPGLAPADAPPDLLVVNPEPERGMLSSVRFGLRALPAEVDGVLLWPVDHPRVIAATVGALLAAHRATGAPVVVPVLGGRRGHPVLFDRRVFPELHDAPDGEGARAVVHAHGDRVELAVDDPGIVDDIDTPGDLARAFGREGSGGTA